MATGQLNRVIEHLRSITIRDDGAGLTDGQLLGRFIEFRDDAAVSALVKRHGAMVWGVCLRILRNQDDAEDAFQATFLVLMRKASAIVPREMLPNWLYGVANQTSLKTRATRAKRHVRERQVAEMPEPALQHDFHDDLQPILDEELRRLPDQYRSVVVLCELEGKTRKQTARQLGCPEGTVASRLATAKRMLAKRLMQRGLTLSCGTLAVALSQSAASACVPASVVSSTIKAATQFAAGQAAAGGVISAKAVAITEGVLRTMLLTKLKTMMVAMLMLGLVGVTALWGGRTGQTAEPVQTQRAEEAKSSSRPEAAPQVRPEAVPQAIKQFQIDCCLVKVIPDSTLDFGKDGKGKCIAEPKMVTGEGQEAHFVSGGEQPVLGVKEAIEIINFGTSFKVKVSRTDNGLIRVDATFERTQIHNSEGDKVEVVGKSVRFISKVKPGESVKLALKDDKGEIEYWVRFKVHFLGTMTFTPAPPINVPAPMLK